MRVDGQNTSFSPDLDSQGGSSTTDQQITDALDVPVQRGDQTAANARRENVRDIFSHLSPADAKELYNRLEKYDYKDPVNDKFYGTFAKETIDSLKQTLKSRFEQQTEPGSTIDKSTQTAKKSEVDAAGKTRANKLNEELEKGPDGPLNIAGRKDLPEYEKQSKINDWLKSASRDDFQNMIERSAGWPKDTQKMLDKVINEMGFGANAQRLVTDLKPDQQIEMLKRLQSEGAESSISILAGGMDKTTLDRVAKEFQNYPNFQIDGHKNPGSAVLLEMLTSRSKELSPDSQRALTDSIINIGNPQDGMSGNRAYYLKNIFDTVKDEKSAQALFAHIQNSGELKKMLANFQEHPINFQKEFIGLGKKELQVIKQTFEQLAAEQPQGSDIQKAYLASAKSAADWT